MLLGKGNSAGFELKRASLRTRKRRRVSFVDRAWPELEVVTGARLQGAELGRAGRTQAVW